MLRQNGGCVMKIVVLAGGISTERDVSLVTGASVCRALRENGHKAIFVDLFLGLDKCRTRWRHCLTPRTDCAQM